MDESPNHGICASLIDRLDNGQNSEIVIPIWADAVVADNFSVGKAPFAINQRQVRKF